MYKKEFFGTMSDERVVERYTLTNKNGISASFLTLGGIWNTMMVPDRNGQMADVVLGYDMVDMYLYNDAHLGEIVGRNANRIGNAQFIFNDITYMLDSNNGPNNLHSGEAFYRNRLWKAGVTEEEGAVSVIFSMRSPAGDQGFPGTADITVTYRLTDENALEIHYTLICDSHTVANMTNHSYFNLAGHNTGSAVDQQVWIDADRYTPMDAVSIPTGEIASVQGTPMDFTKMKPIGRDIDADFEQLSFGSGYDHNWVLNHRPGELSLSAKAYDEKSGRGLEVYTDLPGIQFYTANYLDCVLPGKDRAEYGCRHGYCFETQYYPDAVNKPEFPSTILRAGTEYKTTTIYKFTVI